jgi:hypothetical protein
MAAISITFANGESPPLAFVLKNTYTHIHTLWRYECKGAFAESKLIESELIENKKIFQGCGIIRNQIKRKKTTELVISRLRPLALLN